MKDPDAPGALYDRVLAAFPDAYLEDPHDRCTRAARASGSDVRLHARLALQRSPWECTLTALLLKAWSSNARGHRPWGRRRYQTPHV